MNSSAPKKEASIPNGISPGSIVLARSYLISGQDAQALRQAEQVLNLYPDNTDALLLAGMAHVRMDQPEAALAPLERFVALRREQPMAGADNLLETAYYYLGEISTDIL